MVIIDDPYEFIFMRASSTLIIVNVLSVEWSVAVPNFDVEKLFVLAVADDVT